MPSKSRKSSNDKKCKKSKRRSRSSSRGSSSSSCKSSSRSRSPCRKSRSPRRKSRSPRKSRSHKKSRSPCKSPKKSRSPHKKSRSPCKSPRKSRSPHKKHCDSDSSDSDSDCDFEEQYCYYKKHLLKDPSLMIGGSTAYATLYNTIAPFMIPINTPLLYERNDPAIRKVEYVNTGGDVFVRESGMYCLNFSLETNEPSQFGVYINNILQPDTIIGTNSASGQLTSRVMLSLKKDDSVTVRNHTSSVIGGVVTVIQFAGGVQLQAAIQFTLFKIAPHPDDLCHERSEHYKCHDKHEKFFCRLTEKMLCDPCLMLKGFDAYGTFYSTASQTIQLEAAAVFDYAFDYKGLEWTAGSSNVTVKDAGIYSIFADILTVQAAQFAIFVNGIPLLESTVGTNKGSGVLSTRFITELKSNDILTWVNHTSAVAAVTNQNPGGTTPAINVEICLVKIAPPTCCCEPCKPGNPCCNEKYCEPEDVREFKTYLLHHHKLQVDGAKYLSLDSTTQQALNIGDAVIWKRKTFARGIENTQGKPEVHICEDGEYRIVAGLNTNQPDQMTLFVNGTPWLKTTSGKDSGATTTLIDYNVALCKGDCVTLVNHKSLVNPVLTSSNAGGSEVGANANFIIFRLGAKWEQCKPEPCKPVKA